MYWQDGMYWHGAAMNGWMFIGTVLALAPLWIALIVGLVLALRTFGRVQRPPSPAQILAARFADGTLDEPEYLRRLAVLNRGAAAPGSADDRPGKPD